MKLKERTRVNHKVKPTEKIKITKSVWDSLFHCLSFCLWLAFPPCFVTVFCFSWILCESLSSAGVVLQWQAVAAWRWVVLSCRSTPGRQIQAVGSSNTDRHDAPWVAGQTQRLCKDKGYLSHLLFHSPELSFKARGVSGVQPVLLSFLCSSSSFIPSSTLMKGKFPGVVVATNSISTSPSSLNIINTFINYIYSDLSHICFRSK